MLNAILNPDWGSAKKKKNYQILPRRNSQRSPDFPPAFRRNAQFRIGLVIDPENQTRNTISFKINGTHQFHRRIIFQRL